MASLIIGLRSLRVQKSLSNSDKQIGYLQAKLKLLDEAKAELSLVDYGKIDIELSDRSDLIKALSGYTEKILINLPRIIQKLKGHFDDGKLEEFESRINKVNRHKIDQKAKQILGNEYLGDKEDISVSTDPVNYALSTKEEFKRFLAEQMLAYNKKIERIIEMNSH